MNPYENDNTGILQFEEHWEKQPNADLDIILKLLIKECRKNNPDFNNAKNLITKIIDGGGNINAKNMYNNNILSTAINGNHTKIALFLIKNGADVNANVVNYRFRSVLFSAISFNNETIVEALIKHGADVLVRDTEDKMTPLIWATHLGKRYNIVKMLVNAGADVNAQDAAYMNPFMWAMYHGDKNIARFLFDRGAETTKKCSFGRTAFDLAIKEGHSTVF